MSVPIAEVAKHFIAFVENKFYQLSSEISKKERDIDDWQWSINETEKELVRDRAQLASLKAFFDQLDVTFPRVITISQEELLKGLNE